MYRSASETNDRNRSIAVVLERFDRIYCDPAEAIDLYTRQCSLERDREGPGRDGRDAGRRRRQSADAERVIDAATCRHTLAVMTTAGLYETSGDWLYDVGLPGKSGIGGGIVTVAPGKGGLGTFAPRLDAAGNSVKGQLAARVSLPQPGTRPVRVEARGMRAAPDPARGARARRGGARDGASLKDEQALAKRYAPDVRLVAQAHECGSGESYVPIDVNALFDEPTVALRGPWTGDDLVKIAPAAGDLTASRYEYHLDFPGNPLDPGCDYERWERHITEGTTPTVYAHVATDPAHPGKLALQYWFFYVFNDWNNTHEGDWEMIQLDFDADTAAQALTTTPTSVGYSQHEGAERADWGDDKLELVDGTHPVVHPAAGSHANFYGEALYLGSSAVGRRRLRRHAAGRRSTSARSWRRSRATRRRRWPRFPGSAFDGRWGELQPAFFNGPTGPNLKTQWTEPITWSEGWRDRSLAVPGAGAFGTGATDFFCSAVAAGSNALRRSVDNPLPALVLLAVLVALLVFVFTRTTWRPAHAASASRAAAPGARSSPPPSACTSSGSGSSSASASWCCRSRWS